MRRRNDDGRHVAASGGRLDGKAILLAIHEDVRDREVLEQELTDRHSRGYQIICEASPLSALERLDSLHATAGARLALRGVLRK
jgi:hypothetical protein